MKTYPGSVKAALLCYLTTLSLAVASSTLNIMYAPPELSKPVMVTVAIIAFGLLCLFGYFIAQAKNWARILYAALVILGITLNLISDQPVVLNYSIGEYVYWAQSAFSLLVVVLLFLPASNAWFAAAKKKN